MAARFILHGRYFHHLLSQSHRHAYGLVTGTCNRNSLNYMIGNSKCLCTVQDQEAATGEIHKNGDEFQNGALSQNIISQIFEEDGDETLQNVEKEGYRNKTAARQMANISLDEEQKIATGEALSKYIDTVQEEVSSMDGAKLNNVARMLLALTSVDIPIVEEVENRLLSQLRRMPIKQVFNTMEIHKNHCTTALRTQVYQESVTTLELRWVEISDPKMLVSLFYYMEAKETKEKVFDHLESKALEYAEVMEPKDLYRILYSMCRRKRRNTPLIRALTYYLTKHNINLTPVHMTNLVFSCARLRIHDENLLEAVSVAIADSIGAFTKEQVVSLLKSFRHLRWNHSHVMEFLAGVLLSDSLESEALHLADLILTCSSNNCVPSNVQELYPQIISRLEPLETENPSLWLNVVWSSCVLGHCTSQMAASVLDAGFQESLLSESENGEARQMMNLIKSRNVDSCAELDISGYSGPRLDTSSPLKVPTKSAKHLSSHVVSTLNTIAPKNNYLITDRITQDGYLIDVELVINASGEPQQLAKFSGNPLPDGHHRVAIKVLDFTDMTNSSVKPLGFHSLAAKHLSKQGYKVLELSYKEYPKEDKLVKIVQYLQEKLKALTK